MIYEANPTKITEGSFEIIRREIAEMGVTLAPDIAPIVERMVHSSADFDFATITHVTQNAVSSAVNALRNGCSIVCDVNMIRVGISEKRLEAFGGSLHCFVAVADAYKIAKRDKTTRSVAGIRIAHESSLLNGGIVVVGNAPTALFEVMRLVAEEGVKPALIIGVPVGFIGAVESKAALERVTDAEWLTTRGRKGGSPIAVAVVNALLRIAAESPPTETD